MEAPRPRRYTMNENVDVQTYCQNPSRCILNDIVFSLKNLVFGTY